MRSECVSRVFRMFLYAYCFFRSSIIKSQCAIIASLRPSTTKASTQNLQTIQVIYIFIVVATDSSTACSIRFFGYSLCVISRRILDVSLVFLSYAPTCWRSCCAQRAKSVVRDKVLRRGAVAQRVEVRCT